jgi:uncharacterized protein
MERFMSIQISSSSVQASLTGGVFIGIAASLLLLFNGRIAGVSGILGRLLFSKVSDRAWRVAFLVGLISGGFIFNLLNPISFEFGLHYSIPRLMLAGLLVGFGSQLSGGCTSGHGVCGISRLSMRSIVATVVFMVTGFVTVYLIGFSGDLP